MEGEVQSLENELTLSNEYLTDQQAEFDSVQAEKQALVARVEGLENTGTFNTAAKMEVDSLQMALEESTQEKERLQENLELWKEKYSSLESEVTRLQNEMAYAAQEKLQFEEVLSSCKEEASGKVRVLEVQVKEMEERLYSVDEQERMLTEVIEQKLQLEESKKVEVASLQMTFDEIAKEKERLEETLEACKDKCACLETNVARLENDAASAAEEKLRFEEKLSCAGEEASEQIKKLEGQLKEMEERLTSVNKQEGMLTELIEQKLQLEENHKMEVTSLRTTLEQITQEKEHFEGSLGSWKEKCGSLEIDVSRLHNEIASAEKEKLQFDERLSCAKDEASVKMKELEIELEEMKGRFSDVDEKERMLAEVTEQKLCLEETVVRLEAEVAQNKEISEEKCNIEAHFERFKAEKESEIAQLRKELQELQDQLKISSCGFEEKDMMMTQVVGEKRQMEAKMVRFSLVCLYVRQFQAKRFYFDCL